MKLHLHLTVMLFTIYLKANAQCNPAIPSNAVVVISTQTINGGFDPIWVCKGDTLISNGGFHNIFMEPGAIMTTGGGIDSIYVKKTASFIMNGGIHVIFFEDSNDLNIAGGIPTLDTCSSINFDYLNAPANGCFTHPVANFISSDTSFCENKCINFTDLSYNNPISWQWYFPGATPDTSTLQNPSNICYTNYGSFDISLVACNAFGCDSLYFPAFIHEYQNPPAPVVVESGDTMISSSAYSFQWIETTNPNIILSTDSMYVASLVGNYQVIACDSLGCCSSSNIINIIGVSISVLNFNTDPDIKIIPNPNNGNFTINGRNIHGDEISISVYNYLGEIIFNEIENNISNKFSKKIILPGLPGGIYLMHISSNSFSKYLKVVIAN